MEDVILTPSQYRKTISEMIDVILKYVSRLKMLLI